MEHNAITRLHPLKIDVLNDMATSGPDGLRQAEPLRSIAQLDEADVDRCGILADIVGIGAAVAALLRPFRGSDRQTPLRAENGVRRGHEIRGGWVTGAERLRRFPIAVLPRQLEQASSPIGKAVVWTGVSHSAAVHL